MLKWEIGLFQKYRDILCRPSKMFDKHSFQILHGLKIAQREIEDNAYARFWRENKT